MSFGIVIGNESAIDITENAIETTEKNTSVSTTEDYHKNEIYFTTKLYTNPVKKIFQEIALRNKKLHINNSLIADAGPSLYDYPEVWWTIKTTEPVRIANIFHRNPGEINVVTKAGDKEFKLKMRKEETLKPKIVKPKHKLIKRKKKKKLAQRNGTNKFFKIRRKKKRVTLTTGATAKTVKGDTYMFIINRDDNKGDLSVEANATNILVDIRKKNSSKTIHASVKSAFLINKNDDLGNYDYIIHAVRKKNATSNSESDGYDYYYGNVDDNKEKTIVKVLKPDETGKGLEMLKKGGSILIRPENTGELEKVLKKGVINQMTTKTMTTNVNGIPQQGRFPQPYGPNYPRNANPNMNSFMRNPNFMRNPMNIYGNNANQNFNRNPLQNRNIAGNFQNGNNFARPQYNPNMNNFNRNPNQNFNYNRNQFNRNINHDGYPPYQNFNGIPNAGFNMNQNFDRRRPYNQNFAPQRYNPNANFDPFNKNANYIYKDPGPNQVYASPPISQPNANNNPTFEGDQQRNIGREDNVTRETTTTPATVTEAPIATPDAVSEATIATPDVDNETTFTTTTEETPDPQIDPDAYLPTIAGTGLFEGMGLPGGGAPVTTSTTTTTRRTRGRRTSVITTTILTRPYLMTSVVTMKGGRGPMTISTPPNFEPPTDYIDTMFNEEDGMALFKAVEKIYNFPNVPFGVEKVLRDLSEAIFHPLIRYHGRAKEKVLLDSLNQLIENHMTAAPVQRRHQNYRTKVIKFRSKLKSDVTDLKYINAVANEYNNAKRTANIEPKLFEVIKNNLNKSETKSIDTAKIINLTQKMEKKLRYEIKDDKLTTKNLKISKIQNNNEADNVIVKTTTPMKAAVNMTNTEKHKNKKSHHKKVSINKLLRLKMKHPKMYKKYFKRKKKRTQNKRQRKQKKSHRTQSKYRLSTAEKLLLKYKIIEHEYQKLLKHYSANKKLQKHKIFNKIYNHRKSNDEQSPLSHAKNIAVSRKTMKPKSNKDVSKQKFGRIQKWRPIQVESTDQTTSYLNAKKFTPEDHVLLNKFHNFNKVLTRKSLNGNYNPPIEHSSYSSEGSILKDNIDHAMKHDNFNVIKESRNKINQLSSFSSEEVILKSKIYKILLSNDDSKSSSEELDASYKKRLKDGVRRYLLSRRNFRAIDAMSSYSDDEQLIKKKLNI
ncbi:unnamed protein product [Diatraea saccharalis]|uniref:Uncharacterized protein n=1 Tax=Diatraea saccharalis TaxID=40085 RepID=A0A9N9WH44_9NEOP|nr:unnamed protein product [Diatraea saccharalis]